jgi:GrpB-like predicted nucleotidyltransferase (UPF0157 family)
MVLAAGEKMVMKWIRKPSMAHGETFNLAPDPDAARGAAETLFRTVAKELAGVLPASAEVLHIGATAVPGCLSKGDLDIVVRVDRADFPAAQALLIERWNRNAGSIRTDEFAAFEDAHRAPHLGIQLTVKGGAFDVFHQFVDALLADPALVSRYNELKLRFRDGPMAEYRTAKAAFVVNVLTARGVGAP